MPETVQWTFHFDGQTAGAVKLTELQTGTFEGMKTTGSYSIWYQTNQNGEYRLWRNDIQADTNTHLTVSDLNLAEGEEVTASNTGSER